MSCGGYSCPMCICAAITATSGVHCNTVCSVAAVERRLHGTCDTEVGVCIPCSVFC